MDYKRIVIQYCLLCDEVACKGQGKCEKVMDALRSKAGTTLEYRGKTLEQNDTITCASHGDEVTWELNLDECGYQYVTNHFNHIITITKLPEVAHE